MGIVMIWFSANEIAPLSVIPGFATQPALAGRGEGPE
jgi:hypothetical protein